MSRSSRKRQVVRALAITAALAAIAPAASDASTVGRSGDVLVYNGTGAGSLLTVSHASGYYEFYDENETIQPNDPSCNSIAPHIVECKDDNGGYGPISQLWVYANGGNDSVDAGVSIPTIIDGGPGDNSLRGGSNNDKIYAGSGNDDLHGRGGYDELYAGDGNDYSRRRRPGRPARRRRRQRHARRRRRRRRHPRRHRAGHRRLLDSPGRRDRRPGRLEGR